MTEPALPLLASSTGAHLHLMAMQCQQDLALLEVLHRVTAADAESLTAVAVAMEALAARIRQVHPVQRLDPDGTHRATLSLCVDKAGLLQHTALHRAKGAPKVPLQLQMAQALNQLAPACDQLVKAVAAHDDALERVDPLPTSAPQPAD
ncbi:MAG: hypothetical protein EOP81_17745 [Variovorax sp.]|nr:MAG: hypothetical protein EOP81_17745 [Variovorax sp.]